jgi:hypothetical protein
MTKSALPKDYSLLAWNEAFEMIYENDMDFFKPSRIILIEESIEVFIFQFNDYSFVVIPKYPNAKFSRNKYPAFLCHNRKALDEAIRSKVFPIPDEFTTLIDKESDKLKNIESNYQYYIHYFDSVMGTNFFFEIQFNAIKSIFSDIKKHKNEIYIEKLVLGYFIIIMVFLIENYGANFHVKQVNTGYKPSYIPCVILKNQIVSPYESIGSKELDSSFELFYQMLLVALP